MRGDYRQDVAAWVEPELDEALVPARLDTSQRLVRVELDEQLLPGLPDTITLDLIAPKIPLKEIVSTMPSVSKGWQHVIRSRQVYDARVRSNAKEEFIILNRYFSRRNRYSTALYFPKQKACCYLPPLPQLRRGFPHYCQYVALHGRIYVLGGEDEYHHGTRMGFEMGSSYVFVLDLYGPSQWKTCAHMRAGRVNFGCGILDGKIYVFGGYHCDESFTLSEVYDPEVDTWSEIKSIPTLRSHHKVITVGEDLFVYGGTIYEETNMEGSGEGHFLTGGNALGKAFFVEIYNPVLDEWSSMDPFLEDERAKVLLVGGKLHAIQEFDVYVYDFEEYCWKLLHTPLFPTLGPEDSLRITLLDAIAVNGEVLIRVSATDTGACLLRSRGFGSNNEKLVWEYADGGPSLRGITCVKSEFRALGEL
ncbi:unnamed protein product [Calypogeia fissa]